MFYTLTEVAKKWKLDRVEFLDFTLGNHFDKLLSNPDVSASGADSYVISDSVAYGLVNKFMTKDVQLPTNDELRTLEEAAITAMATYLASMNVASSFDFNQDMRLEGEDDCDPADFMCQRDVMGDHVSDMEDSIYSLTATIQKKLAEEIKK